MAKLVFRRLGAEPGPERPELALGNEDVLITHGSEATIVLGSSEPSHFRLRIFKQNGHYVLQDLMSHTEPLRHSTSDFCLNGGISGFAGPGWRLGHADEIQVGDWMVYFVEDDDATPADTHTPRRSSGTAPVPEVNQGSQPGNVLGQGPEAQRA